MMALTLLLIGNLFNSPIALPWIAVAAGMDYVSFYLSRDIIFLRGKLEAAKEIHQEIQKLSCASPAERKS